MIANKLHYGDTIGIIAPASPENSSIIKEKLTIIANLGFKVKESPHLYDKNGYLAGDDKSRARDLVNMFLDPDVNMVMCLRGGYGTMRILPFINFDIIRKNPKIFIGFSDITTLLNGFYERCNLVTFHGAMANSNLQDEITLKSFLSTLMEGHKTYFIENPLNYPLKFYNFKKPVHGRIVGGNLSLLCSTLGTKYEVNCEDRILFMEDIDEPPYKIDRLLTQLILSGKLQQCRAILLGQFTNCNSTQYAKSLTLKQVFSDRLLPLNIPICSNLMSGHGMPKLTIPIGARVALSPMTEYIEVLEPVVK